MVVNGWLGWTDKFLKILEKFNMWSSLLKIYQDNIFCKESKTGS